MNFKSAWLATIVIVLLLMISAVSATISIERVDWAKVHYGDASGEVVLFVNNDGEQQEGIPVLNIDGSPAHQENPTYVTIPANAKHFRIPITIQVSGYPRGNYHACVWINFNLTDQTCSPNGLIVL